VKGEDSLDADILDDAADDDHLIDAAALAGEKDALENLGALLLAFDNANVDVKGVADVELREVLFQGSGGDRIEDGLARVGLLRHGLKIPTKLGRDGRQGWSAFGC
jgi:hypothetical protein